MEKTSRINPIKEFFKKIAFRYTGLGTPQYRYCLEPIQLAKIILSLEELAQTEGNVLEVGVARGLTSRFIAQHLSLQDNIPNFYCIDTFSSFTQEDINYEVQHRNKKFHLKNWGFQYNDYRTWAKNFKNFSFVKPIQADVKTFDFSTVSPIKFAFLDVDLYLPMKKALEHMRPYLTKGAIVMFDDVYENTLVDGAHEVFIDFIKANKEIKWERHGSKGGLLRF